MIFNLFKQVSPDSREVALVGAFENRADAEAAIPEGEEDSHHIECADGTVSAVIE